MEYQTIAFTVEGEVARLTLNRPSVRNAMNGTMYDEARAVIRDVETRDDIRVLVLTGAGATFCSGGDLQYQLAQAQRPHAERLAEAAKLSLWLGELDRCSKPIVGRINGLAFGGGIGLLSCCDFVVAREDATFSLPEVSIGLLPSMIAPYVVARVGVARARSFFLNARILNAVEAQAIGLVDETASEADLDAAVLRHVKGYLRCAPKAIASTKRLIREVAHRGPADSHDHTINLVAKMWTTEEAAEGIESFLAKQEPSWRV
jgi:methylglutaconyl-CoA hydratase